MTKQYQHLSVEERAVIMIEHRGGSGKRSIARTLGRSPSTISREIKRHAASMAVLAVGVDALAYDATRAAQGYRQRRQASRRRHKWVVGSALYQHVHDRLIYSCWSPQQIAAKLRIMNPDDASRRISHETIYASIYAYPRGALKQGMLDALRQRKPARGNRRTTLAKGQTVPEALRIVHRPEDIQQRSLPGHWEGDFIKGSFNRSAVGTVVERKTTLRGVVPDGRLHGS